MKKNIFCIVKVHEERSRTDSDLLVRSTDPWIRIRTKMSRIPNTGFQKCFFHACATKSGALTKVIQSLNSDRRLAFVVGMNLKYPL
jgi:hypothetical protein